MIPIGKTDFPAASWRKSSYSSGSGGACVEVAPNATAVGVRDTKDRARGHFAVRRSAWKAFVDSVKNA